MNKRAIGLLLSLGLMMAMAIPAGATSGTHLHEPHKGTECANGFATLHFVHNQHRGTGSLANTIEVDFGGIVNFTFPATKANRGTVHFTIDVEGMEFTTLVDAWDDIPQGRLVLSDYECDDDAGSGGSSN